jgi:hypothetical protein
MKEQNVHQDTKLVITIKNNQPIELADLTKSLSSLASQFSSFVAKNGIHKEERESKLYVKEIKQGSIIIELIEPYLAILPAIADFNSIFEFAQYLKRGFEYLLNRNNSKDKQARAAPDLEIEQNIKELSSIVTPIVKDGNSTIHIDTLVCGNVINNFYFNSNESQCIQQNATNLLKSLKETEIEKDIHPKVVLVLSQARSDSNKKGNKGKIESLSDKELNILIEKDDIKAIMLDRQTNPFKMAFVVDVRIENINNKPAIYRVINLHEDDCFEIDDNNI